MHGRTLLLLLLALAFGCTDNEIPAGQCRYDSDCDSGEVCAGTYCRAGCRVDRDCPTGQRCGESDRVGVNTCIPMMIQAACNRASDCPAGLVCLDGACRPQCQRDYDCQVLNPFFSCVSNVCALTCASGTGDCDGDPRNGCETSLVSDPTHCGTCTSTCTGAPNADATCASSACSTRCRAGFADCDGNAANGCEVDLTGDVAHCGACATTCAGAPNADAACVASACATRCRAGFADCDGNAANGCEVDLSSDAAHCGACATTCAAPANADATCAASTCGRQCRAGFADCDGNAANGCEVTLATDAAHCGTCASTCPTATNAEGVCMASMCGRQCRAGFADCDGDATNGCEVTLATDAAHCGTCATACSFPHASAVCAAGVCGLGTCASGYGNCDGDPSNGCETPLDTSAHCGACATVCTAAMLCSQGGCTSRCTGGTTYCGESCVNTATNPANCGACGTVCPGVVNGAGTCVSSVCGFTCNPGYVRLGEGCAPIGAPRLLAPASLATANGNGSVAFDVVLAANTDGALIELCRDRACTMVVDRTQGTGSHIARTTTLSAGLYFWRAYGRVGSNVGLTASTQTWELVVPARAGSHTASWGVFPDLNGDGFADLAVGESGSNTVVVHHGSTTGIGATPTRTLSSTTLVNGFGAYTAAGDFNGDGFADLAVSNDGGSIFVYAGSATGLAAAPTPLVSAPANGYAGVMTAVSDLDHNGYGDLAVAYTLCDKGCRSGVHVYFGRATGLDPTPVNIDAPNSYTSIDEIAAAGRIGADATYDSLVMLFNSKGSVSVRVYRGTSTGMNTEPVQTFSPPSQTYHLAAANDVNGDGFGDVVFSTLAFREPSSVSVNLGGATGLSPSAAITLTDPTSLGGSVAGVGDVNGDGFADVLAGNDFSAVRLYLGGPTTALTAGPRLDAPTPPSGSRYSNYGSYLPFVGDFNHDNLMDIGIGAPNDGDGDCDTEFFIHLGRPDTTGTFTPVRILVLPDTGCGGGGVASWLHTPGPSRRT